MYDLSFHLGVLGDLPELEAIDSVKLMGGLDEEGKARSQKILMDYSQQDDGYALSEHLINVLDGEEDAIISMELARKHMEIIFKCYEKADNF